MSERRETPAVEPVDGPAPDLVDVPVPELVEGPQSEAVETFPAIKGLDDLLGGSITANTCSIDGTCD